MSKFTKILYLNIYLWGIVVNDSVTNGLVAPCAILLALLSYFKMPR